LGELVGARSGDKGGNANIGVWVRDRARYDWLLNFLTPERLRTLLPRPFAGRIERFEFANMGAVNFVLYDYLGEGAFANVYIDNQAKLLGEQIRAMEIDVTG
jgi:hypothetical protein